MAVTKKSLTSKKSTKPAAKPVATKASGPVTSGKMVSASRFKPALRAL